MTLPDPFCVWLMVCILFATIGVQPSSYNTGGKTCLVLVSRHFTVDVFARVFDLLEDMVISYSTQQASER